MSVGRGEGLISRTYADTWVRLLEYAEGLPNLGDGANFCLLLNFFLLVVEFLNTAHTAHATARVSCSAGVNERKRDR